MAVDFARLWKHATTGRWTRARLFPQPALDAITAAVKSAEARHAGEIRVAIEAALPLEAVAAGMSPRERAVDVFTELRVWDTEDNNGVLIYLLLADRDVEIVADRGIARGAGPGEWEACCRMIEGHAREGRFADGVVAGIDAVAAVLQRYPGQRPDVGNEQPDHPVLL